MRWHAGRVTEDGASLRFRHLPGWLRSIARQKGHDVEVAIRRAAEPTTVDQHGYYRAVVLPLAAEEWGWGNPAQLHRGLKLLHLPKIVPTDDPRWRTCRIGASTYAEPPSMGELSREESSAYIDAVIRQMQEDGINVPPPRGSE